MMDADEQIGTAMEDFSYGMEDAKWAVEDAIDNLN